MNNMEEKLWEYIDGTCTEEERISIAALIDSDEQWRKTYNEMLQLNAEIAAIDTDEPSMAFSYKVMEGIRTQEASRPLKTTISKFVVNGVAAFFVLSILVILLAMFKGDPQAVANITGDYVALPNMSVLADSSVTQAFVYFDILLLLFFVDAYIRRKRHIAVVKSV